MYGNSTKRELFEKFVDRTSGESTKYNRLVTRENDAENVILLGYGWLKLAEYDESRNLVTIFTGHQAIESETVSQWLNEILQVAEERGRSVVLSGESPTDGEPNKGVQFINEYVSFASRSPVEENAVNLVRESLADV